MQKYVLGPASQLQINGPASINDGNFVMLPKTRWAPASSNRAAGVKAAYPINIISLVTAAATPVGKSSTTTHAVRDTPP